MSTKPGYRYAVSQQFQMIEVSPGRFTGVAAAPLTYLVEDRSTGKEVESFPSLQDARKRCDELNTAEVTASLNLDPEFALRRERLRELGETFWVAYGDEGHPETRWPERPGRYAVETYFDRYSESFWDTCETLQEVEQAILDRDVVRVVDLDENRDVRFHVSVSIDQ